MTILVTEQFDLICSVLNKLAETNNRKHLKLIYNNRQMPNKI